MGWTDVNRLVEEQRKMSKLLALAYMAATVITIVTAYQYGYDSGYTEKENDLKVCAEEVSNGCPNVTTYAVMLEKENARLNKKCKQSGAD